MKNQFTQQIETAILRTFPESYVSAEIMKIVGEPFCRITFLVAKDKSECPHNISDNDHAKHHIAIHGFNEDGSFKSDILEVESRSGSFYTKPPVGSYLALGRVKTGWRNFKANEKKTIERIEQYFVKLKQLLNENFDILTEHDQQLMIKKGYKQ